MFDQNHTAMFTVDVEEWFHILDSPAAPPIEKWNSLQSRVESRLEMILGMLDQCGIKATFFWLGWLAQQHKSMVLRCRKAGHEIASHGYAHVLAYDVGCERFFQDIDRAKKLLEDITGDEIAGFRAPGFGITRDTAWAFDVIKQVGYRYDSSIFPSARGHGGIPGAALGSYLIETRAGLLPEVSMSMIEILGRRVNLFGGGYLRISPQWLIRWGIGKLRSSGQPLVVYVHPREIDPDHPRLPMSPLRRFKSYVNLKSTMPKLRWLAGSQSFCLMRDFVFAGGKEPAKTLPIQQSTFRYRRAA